MFMLAHEKKKLLNMKEVVMNVGMIKLLINLSINKKRFSFQINFLFKLIIQ